jgi:hypothetical protein
VDQVATLLRRFLSERGSLRMLADCGERMAEGFELKKGSPVLVAPFTAEAVGSPGRWGFVDQLRRIFSHRPPEAAVPLVGIFKDPASIDPLAPPTKNFTPLEIPGWLRNQRMPCHLLILVASRDDAAREQISGGENPPRDEEEMRSRLAVLYRAAFSQVRNSIRSALVIDVSRGQGDALPLALGLAALEDFHGDFAYWDPQASE